MFSYFFVFFTISLFSIISLNVEKKNLLLVSFSKTLWLFFIIFLTLFIGLREEVGGDWIIYQMNYDFLFNKILPSKLSLIDYLNTRDKEYFFESLLFISVKYDLSMFFVNIVCAVISIFFLKKFYEYQPNKYLAVIISFPVFILVVLMGFTRQGVACCILFYGIICLFDKKILSFSLLILLASLFHISALITFFFLIPCLRINLKFILIIILLIIISIFIFVYQYNTIENLIFIYFGENKESHFEIPKGAIFRILLVIIPAVIYLIFNKKITSNKNERNVMLFASYASLFFIIFFVSFTAGIDRIFYYFIFIPIYVLSRLPYIFNSFHLLISIKLLLIVLNFFIMAVWFYMGIHSHLWIPYNNLLF